MKEEALLLLYTGLAGILALVLISLVMRLMKKPPKQQKIDPNKLKPWMKNKPCVCGSGKKFKNCCWIRAMMVKNGKVWGLVNGDINLNCGYRKHVHGDFRCLCKNPVDLCIDEKSCPLKK